MTPTKTRPVGPFGFARIFVYSIGTAPPGSGSTLIASPW